VEKVREVIDDLVFVRTAVLPDFNQSKIQKPIDKLIVIQSLRHRFL
jgi:hypothetical protein